jgi:hypothetical protein
MRITVMRRIAPRRIEIEIEKGHGLFGHAKYEEGHEMAYVRFGGALGGDYTRQECLVAIEFFTKVADLMLPSPSIEPKAPRTGSRKARVTP